MFTLVSRRYERASMIVTSNEPLIGWGEIFGDDIVAAAMIDRLVHHADQILDSIARYEDDLVVCLLRGGFSRVEQTLLEGGLGDSVIQQRMEFQDLMRERFQAVIADVTGRRVIGFMSGTSRTPTSCAKSSSSPRPTSSTTTSCPAANRRLAGDRGAAAARSAHCARRLTGRATPIIARRGAER